MKAKNSQRQLIEMYLLQSADEPVSVMNQEELAEFALYFPDAEQVTNSEPPYDWNFVVFLCCAFGVPIEFACNPRYSPIDPITDMMLRRVARYDRAS